ncbi:MAG: hypothetical protein ACOY3H_04880 [Bacillota bacterium]
MHVALLSWWPIITAYLLLYSTLLGKRGTWLQVLGLGLVLAIADGAVIALLKQAGLPYGLHIPVSLVMMALGVGIVWRRLWFGLLVAVLSYLTMIVLDIFTGIMVVKILHQQDFLEKALKDWRLMILTGQLQTIPIYVAAWWTGRRRIVWFDLYQRRIRG